MRRTIYPRLTSSSGVLVGGGTGARLNCRTCGAILSFWLGFCRVVMGEGLVEMDAAWLVDEKECLDAKELN